MKIQILDRYEPTSEWHELYANETLLFEGESPPHAQLQLFMAWLAQQPDIEVEIRAFTVEYKQKEGQEFMPPLRTMTGDLYWSDWEKAEGI